MMMRTYRWSQHHNTLFTVAEELFRREEMTDVTLAVGQQFFSAHRFMLSLTSAFFRSLFRRLTHQTPVVFLKDVEPAILELVLQFVYKGEVDVPQHQLRNFLLTARSLEILGLDDYQDSDLCVPTAAPPIPNHLSHKRTNENRKKSSEKRMKPTETALGDSERVEIKLEVDPTDLSLATNADLQPPGQTESQPPGGGNIKLEEPDWSSSAPAEPPQEGGMAALVHSQPVSCSWCLEYFDRRANPLPCFKCNLWFHLKCRCRHEC